MKQRIKSLLAAMMLTITSVASSLAFVPMAVSAETTTDYFATVYAETNDPGTGRVVAEPGGRVTITLELTDEQKAVAETSLDTMTWYCDGQDISQRIVGSPNELTAADTFTGDGNPYRYEKGYDASTGRATLYIPEFCDYTFTFDGDGKVTGITVQEGPATSASHKYTVTVGGMLCPGAAKLTVFSTNRINSVALSAPTVKRDVNATLRADEIPIIVSGSQYPNIGSLKFYNITETGNPLSGKTADSIKVKRGTNTYDLIETVTGKTFTVTVVGLTDTTKPTITSLMVKDNMADKWATEKTIIGTATDNSSLSSSAYYFEPNPTIATAIKEQVIKGALAEEIGGIAWTNANSKLVTSNGVYTMFVRDTVGNIAYRDITVYKISTSVPVISGVTLGKADGNAYFDVKATDEDGQSLSYKVNDGGYQTSPRVYGLKEGTNTIWVKNEAGAEVYTTRDVALSVYLDNDSDLSADNLYNFIQPNPETWTNESVNVQLLLPDSLYSKIATGGFSVNGSGFGVNRNYTATQQGELVYFSVKDTYGNVHSAKPYKVENIDHDKPSISASSNGKGVITVEAQDMASGIKMITVSSNSMKNHILLQEATSGIKTATATYTSNLNGSFQFAVTDFAGNTNNITYTLSEIVTTDETTEDIIKKTTTPKTTTPRSGGTTFSRSGGSTIGTRTSFGGKTANPTSTQIAAEHAGQGTYYDQDGNKFYEDGTPVPEDIDTTSFLPTPTMTTSGEGEERNKLASTLYIIESDARLANGPVKEIASLTYEDSARKSLTKVLIAFPIAICVAVCAVLFGSGKLDLNKIARKIRRRH